eukprot:4529931-Alexandrium_andersonii.AAC.1
MQDEQFAGGGGHWGRRDDGVNEGDNDEIGNNMFDGAGERLLQALRPGELGRPHALRADAPAFAPCWWTE